MKKYLKFAVMAAFALVTVYNVHKVQTEDDLDTGICLMPS